MGKSGLFTRNGSAGKTPTISSHIDDIWLAILRFWIKMFQISSLHLPACSWGAMSGVFGLRFVFYLNAIDVTSD